MKRTLVISNACFSDEGSNGRTLKSLFRGTDKDKLAQFFVYGKPDFGVCKKYYRVGDKEALKSIFPFVKMNGVVEEKAMKDQGTNEVPQSVEKLVHKTPLKVLMREIIWKLARWDKESFWKWLDDFAPQVICLFIASNTFLIRLAILVAKKYNIPVIVYSTEGYSFMDYNYFTNRPSVAYRLYYAWLCREYKKVAAYTKCGFFNSTLLRDKYQSKYGYPCKCLMNSSEIEYLAHPQVDSERGMTISYLGNLGLGRYKALIEVAQVLQEIDNQLYLEVYGAAPSEDANNELTKCPGIRFRGFVPYDEVVRVIHNSGLLIHAELNDAIVNRDLKFAFSTKIADCICSGTPLLLYANETLAETVFLKENECAFIAHDRAGLKEVLKQALTDEEQRQKVIDNAKIAKEKFLTGNSALIQMLS